MSMGRCRTQGMAQRRRWLTWAGALALPGLLHPPAAMAQASGPGGAAPAASAATQNAAADTSAQEAKAPPLPAAGTRLALPALELLDGQRLEPLWAEGRVLVLYWWASWCPFCALTSPHIDKLWQAERGRGLALLTFSIDKNPDDARAYLKRRGYAWPTAWAGAGTALQRLLPKPRGLPVTLVRGRNGRVLQAEGGQLFPEDVEALARHLG